MVEKFKEIKEKYKLLKSVTFVLNKDGSIDINCKRARGNVPKASYAQADYIYSFENIISKSKSNIMKTNKYAASAIISIAKDYQGITFYLNI